MANETVFKRYKHNPIVTANAVILDDTVRIYYGCADTCVSIADANINELINFIKEHSL